MKLQGEEGLADLLDQPKSGSQAQWSTPAPRRELRVRTVDFSQPTKFTKEEQRHLRRAHETFCRTASTRLSADFRMPIDLELIAGTQYTWSSALSESQNETVCAVVRATPSGDRFAMLIDLPLLLSLIERLFGGDAGKIPPDRPLSDIDMKIGARVLEMLLEQLSVVWRDLLGLDLEFVDFEPEPATAGIVPLSEPVLSLTTEARIARSSFTLTTLIPYTMVDTAPLSLQANGRDGGPDDRSALLMREAVGGATVEMRAEVGGVEMRAEDVLGLTVGDRVTVGPASADSIKLCVDSVPVHTTRAGRNGHRRAVQILGPAESRG
jgi:flagellar motor switch protein FliM